MKFSQSSNLGDFQLTRKVVVFAPNIEQAMVEMGSRKECNIDDVAPTMMNMGGGKWSGSGTWMVDE